MDSNSEALLTAGIAKHYQELLDTQDNPSRLFRDETERVKCSKCGNYFRLGFGMMADEHVSAIALRHLDICEGDAAGTLARLAREFDEEAPWMAALKPWRLPLQYVPPVFGR